MENGTTLNIGITATDEASGPLQAASDSVADLNAQIADSTPAINDMNAGLDEVSGSATGAAGALDRTAVSADAAGASTAEAGGVAAESSGGFDLLGGSMLKAFAPLAAMFLGFEGLKATFGDAKTEADQLAAANAQIGNSLKNTNDAVGMSITQIDKMAASTAKNTDITKAANTTVAAQFVSLQGMNSQTMPKAIELTDDLATKMAEMKGKAVPSMQQTSMAAKAMSKALEDPTTATAAFARAGVTLTSSQIAQIKAIAATTNATLTQTRSIQGVTTAGAVALSNWSQLTTAQQTAAETADGITSSQITAAKAFGTANAQTAAQTQLMSDLSDQVNGAATAATQTFAGKVTELKNQLIDLAGKGMADVEKGLGDLGADFMKILPTIDKIIDAVVKFLKPAFDSLVHTIRDNLMPTIDAHKKGLEDIAKVIGGVVVVALYIMVATIRRIITLFTALIDVISFAINAFSDISKAIQSFVGAVAGGVEAAFNFLTSLPGKILSAVVNFPTLLYNAGKSLIDGLIKGIEDAAGAVFKSVEDIGDKAVNALKGVLKIFSPSQVFADIGTNIGAGLAQGISGSESTVSKASAQLGQTTISGVQSTPNLNTNGLNSPGSVSNTTANNTTNSQSVTIQNLTIQPPNGSTFQSIMASINQDSLNASKGLTVVGGAI